jgi:hypothetical protein
MRRRNGAIRAETEVPGSVDEIGSELASVRRIPFFPAEKSCLPTANPSRLRS